MLILMVFSCLCCCHSSAAKLAYANKTKESITSQKLVSQDFWQMNNEQNIFYKIYIFHFTNFKGMQCKLVNLIWGEALKECTLYKSRVQNK